MAQKIIVEGYRADGPVAPLSDFTAALQNAVPGLSEAHAGNLLVRPPFEIDRTYPENEAAAVRAELERLGARVRLEQVEDPTWWRDRHGDTAFGAPSPEFAQPAPSPAPPRGFWDTWTEVVFHPSRFFASDQVRVGGGSPLLFAIAVSVLAAVLSVPGGYVLGSLFQPEGTSLTGQVAAAVLGTPLAVIFFMLFGAASIHVSAKVFGGEGGFDVAWRIVAYSAAVNVFQVIPIFGHLLMFFLYYVYSVAGFQGSYKMTPARSAAAAAFPMFLMLAFFALLVTAIALAIGLSGLKEMFDTMQTSTQGI